MTGFGAWNFPVMVPSSFPAHSEPVEESKPLPTVILSIAKNLTPWLTLILTLPIREGLPHNDSGNDAKGSRLLSWSYRLCLSS